MTSQKYMYHAVLWNFDSGKVWWIQVTGYPPTV